MSAFTPGTMREIPDPQAEIDRLAQARLTPPGRVWGICHPRFAGDRASTDHVTVRADGQPFKTRQAAEDERVRLNLAHECCFRGVMHTLVYADSPLWRNE